MSTIAEGAQRKKARSPNFPGIDLKEAIERAGQLYEKERLNPTPGEIVLGHWGYAKASSSGLVALGALRSFGLLQGDGMALRLSDLARDIVQDTRPESSSRDAAIKRAALQPKIHQEVLAKFREGVSDANLEHYLVREKDFTDKGAQAFIKQFRATLAFAKITASDKLPEGEGKETEADLPLSDIAVGDFVQWTSQGIDRFPIPKRVTSLSDDGTHAMVEGTATGLPVDQLQRVDSPDPPAGRTSSRPEKRPGMNQDTLTLDEGQVVLQWPATISPENYEDLKDWLELMSRRIKRAVKSEEAVESTPPE